MWLFLLLLLCLLLWEQGRPALWQDSLARAHDPSCIGGAIIVRR